MLFTILALDVPNGKYLFLGGMHGAIAPWWNKRKTQC